MDEQFETAGNTDSDLIFDDQVSTHSGDHGSWNGSSSEDENVMPRGTPYPLHSKRLKVSSKNRGALGFVRDAPAGQTRKLIEAKLLEMDHQPSDVQVVVQGTDLEGLCDMFFIDENGIIKSIKGAIKHVSEHEGYAVHWAN